MPRLKRTPAAKADAADIWHHIALDNFDAAERWLMTVDSKIRLLAEFPGLGPFRESLGPGLQSYPIGNYLIFYRQIKDGIEIIRILHGGRDLPKVLGD